MIPFILTAVGAYLVGSSQREKQVFAKGGSIQNNYDTPFKYPEEVWDAWTIKQRTHFLTDHAHQFTNAKFDIADSFDRMMTWQDVAKGYDYEELPIEVRISIVEHVVEGQYADGGMMEKGGKTNCLLI